MSTVMGTPGTIADRGCPYCGNGSWHNGLCSRIKSIEYHPNGSVKRVELR